MNNNCKLCEYCEIDGTFDQPRANCKACNTNILFLLFKHKLLANINIQTIPDRCPYRKEFHINNVLR